MPPVEFVHSVHCILPSQVKGPAQLSTETCSRRETVRRRSEELMDSSVQTNFVWVATAALAMSVATVFWCARQRSCDDETDSEPSELEYKAIYDRTLAEDQRVHPCRSEAVLVGTSTNVVVEPSWLLPFRFSKPLLEGILGYDPTTSPAIERFDAIRKQTHCLFASRARLWGAPSWRDELSLEDNVRRALPAIALFCSCQRDVDGFVLAPRRVD